jgi:prepilin-type N-terminal cleavage/methylation domain-containing protein
MNKKGFTLVEVLIATFILSIAIMSMSAAFKQFFSYKERFEKYKNFYVSVLSIVDEISEKDLEEKPAGEGEINQLYFQYKTILVAKKRNFSFDAEFDLASTNQGPFEMRLYKVELNVGNKKFEFFTTQYKKLFTMPVI